MRSLVFGKNGKDYYMNNLNGTVMGYPVNGSLIFNNDLPLLVGNMMVYDLTIPFLLFFARTRLFAFLIVIVFHILTKLLFLAMDKYGGDFF